VPRTAQGGNQGAASILKSHLWGLNQLGHLGLLRRSKRMKGLARFTFLQGHSARVVLRNVFGRESGRSLNWTSFGATDMTSPNHGSERSY
jgi:hypothetical protein